MKTKTKPAARRKFVRPSTRQRPGTKTKRMSDPTQKTDNGTATRPAAAADEAERSGNVDKIREIIFGTQMRDYDTKFARVEDRLFKEAADLREDIKRRFASLEAFIKSELAALTEADKTERTERAAAVKELAAEAKDHAKGAEKKATQLEEQSAKAQRELRQLIFDESKRLAEEIEQKHAAAASELGREAREIRGTLTDRHALSDLFAELALRLNDDPKAAGK